MSDTTTAEYGPGTNTGHGHVWPRPDRAVYRCGGPKLCKQCAADAATWVRRTTWTHSDTGEVRPVSAAEGGGDDATASSERCPRCGSDRWVSVSLNGGWTLSEQCVPCGKIRRKVKRGASDA